MKLRAVLLTGAGILGFAAAASGTVIVIDDDGDNDGVAGPNVVTVALSSHDNGGWGPAWDMFNDPSAYNGGGDDFNTNTPGIASATYTFNAPLGVVAGGTYNVYVYGRQQGNTGPAIYTVGDGGGAVGVDMTLAPTADIMILDPDPNGDNGGVTHFGFQKIGTVVEDGDGVIAVVLASTADNFINVDAVAIEFVPEPGSLALLGLGGLALLLRRRR